MSILSGLMTLMATVGRYKGIVSSDDRGVSIITPWNARTNKGMSIEHLNATVKMLIKRQLDSKNYIDIPSCHGVPTKRNGDELKSFRKDKTL
jgi:hypothetical protein